ncbi:MAG: ATP-dependent RecD-like DNA helicase [Lachnospiraceae bacterium]|nr:ATP-dependent RecD-like DNA helicase [Lachnospiraceae bacterium]
MDIVEGYVEKIVYKNADNGYTVLSVSSDRDEITCVGTFQYINEGEYVVLEGHFKEHASYGEQLVVEKYEIKVPEDEQAVVRYLGSGAIKGVGPALADRIVRRFKEDTFRIIEEEPERLAEVKGISQRMAMEIASQLEEKKDMRKAMIFLQQYGISMALSVKIYNKYGLDMYRVIKENPYKLADDISGVGFKIADEIAEKAGISRDSDFRIKSAILYVLSAAGANGHACVPSDELSRMASELLILQDIDIDKHLMDMQLDKRIVVKQKADEEGIIRSMVYASIYYYTELNIAVKLSELNIRDNIPREKILKKLEKIENSSGIELDELQRQAVVEAVNSGIMIITGGPGTGKTTTINTIIKMFESEGMEIMLGAPTGRAAKRMTEATGYPAQTIHRMLELNGVPDESSASIMRFEKNEQNPLEADAIIIDECSMVDMFLMHALLKAVSVGTRLILVGDVNQLPSVGPGNVLKDIIGSRSFNTVMLTKIFRQATQSDIVLNAHKINAGESVSLDNNSKDFLFVRRGEANQVIAATLTLVKDKLPKYVGSTANEVQVLTPMRKGVLGVENLNIVLQEHLNPKSDTKREYVTASGVFREGDKVMQIKNNYQMEWEIRTSRGVTIENGVGVFNGDTGTIRSINTYMECMEVAFDDGKVVNYSFKQLDELELAYAVTIHKSQGSEYPAVVLPLLVGPRMLMNRNLLYTAVTRAKKCVTIVGIQDAVDEMIRNVNEQKRYSGLQDRICEVTSM